MSVLQHQSRSWTRNLKVWNCGRHELEAFSLPTFQPSQAQCPKPAAPARMPGPGDHQALPGEKGGSSMFVAEVGLRCGFGVIKKFESRVCSTHCDKPEALCNVNGLTSPSSCTQNLPCPPTSSDFWTKRPNPANHYDRIALNATPSVQKGLDHSLLERNWVPGQKIQLEKGLRKLVTTGGWHAASRQDLEPPAQLFPYFRHMPQPVSQVRSKTPKLEI